MADELKDLFEDLRARTLSEIVAPGAPKVRATVRRRRGVTAFAGTGVAVTAVLIGAGALLHPGADSDYLVGGASPGEDPSSFQPPVIPDPTGPEFDRAMAAAGMLADRSRTPTSITATEGVVGSDYGNDLNDMPADTYTFRFFCVGSGYVSVVIRDDANLKTLGQGTAACAEKDPAPLRLTINQLAYGYLRLSASGDAQSNDQAGFAFEFLSATGKTTFGPSGPPLSFSPSN